MLERIFFFPYVEGVCYFPPSHPVPSSVLLNEEHIPESLIPPSPPPFHPLLPPTMSIFAACRFPCKSICQRCHKWWPRTSLPGQTTRSLVKRSVGKTQLRIPTGTARWRRSGNVACADRRGCGASLLSCTSKHWLIEGIWEYQSFMSRRLERRGGGGAHVCGYCIVCSLFQSLLIGCSRAACPIPLY